MFVYVRCEYYGSFKAHRNSACGVQSGRVSLPVLQEKLDIMKMLDKIETECGKCDDVIVKHNVA